MRWFFFYIIYPVCYLQEENSRYEINSVPAISKIPSIPPPTINITSIPIANQNNVYPQIRFTAAPRKHQLYYYNMMREQKVIQSMIPQLRSPLLFHQKFRPNRHHAFQM